jgi:glycosyltransferase involved in cell wall biosynthesis
MSVTCVLPCKGRLQTLRSAVNTLLKQTYPDDFRVLVVDYGCPDGTWDWCHQIKASRLFCVQVLDDTDIFNLSRARNCGNRVVQTKLIVTLDADSALYCPNMVQSMVAPIVTRAAQSSITNLTDRNGQYFPGQSYMAYLRDDWVSIRGYDEAMTGWGFEDTDFFVRIQGLGACTRLRATHRDFERIAHSDAERTAYYIDHDLGRTWQRNKGLSQSRTKVNPNGFAVFRYRYLCSRSGQISTGRFPALRSFGRRYEP